MAVSQLVLWAQLTTKDYIRAANMAALYTMLVTFCYTTAAESEYLPSGTRSAEILLSFSSISFSKFNSMEASPLVLFKEVRKKDRLTHE